MGERNRLEVKIFGKDYVLHSTRPDEEMRQVVAYVQRKIQEASSESTRYNKTMQATLACINLADENFQLKTQTDAIRLEEKEQRDKVAEQESHILKLQQQLEQQKKANAQKDSELKALWDSLEESENKRLDLAKQFQEYQRTHR